jgi:hypothetical protein
VKLKREAWRAFQAVTTFLQKLQAENYKNFSMPTKSWDEKCH